MCNVGIDNNVRFRFLVYFGVSGFCSGATLYQQGEVNGIIHLFMLVVCKLDYGKLMIVCGALIFLVDFMGHVTTTSTRPYLYEFIFCV